MSCYLANINRSYNFFCNKILLSLQNEYFFRNRKGVSPRLPKFYVLVSLETVFLNDLLLCLFIPPNFNKVKYCNFLNVYCKFQFILSSRVSPISCHKLNTHPDTLIKLFIHSFIHVLIVSGSVSQRWTAWVIVKS